MRSILIPFFLSLSAGLTIADTLPEKKRTLTGLYVTAAEAGGMLEDESILLVDIRSRAEVAFLGLPVRADARWKNAGLPWSYDVSAAQTYRSGY